MISHSTRVPGHPGTPDNKCGVSRHSLRTISHVLADAPQAMRFDAPNANNNFRKLQLLFVAVKFSPDSNQPEYPGTPGIPTPVPGYVLLVTLEVPLLILGIPGVPTGYPEYP
eukprot:1603608-Rhodomonas_salina.1